MAYWHLTKNHVSVEVTEDEARHLESQGETITTDPFVAANWEDEYNETYRKGKCTCGDMNMSRHRHIKHVDYGDLRCEDCGTTWYCD